MDDAFFRSILDHLEDGVYVTDAARRVVFWNKAAERITGYRADEVVGLSCSQDILVHVDEHGAQLCGGPCPLAAALSSGDPHEQDVFLHHHDGHRVPVRVQVQPLRDDADRVVGALEVFRDNTNRLTELRKIEELKAFAYLDPVTGVGNRRYSELTLQARLDELRRYGWSFAVLFIDVDNFKTINDDFGHEVGDRVVRMVGRTLAGSLRTFDFLGRWGGDEFIAVVPMQLDSMLPPLADRCRALAEQSSLQAGGRTMHLTVSIGATMARASDTPEVLIARVDELMYQSKLAGRNRVTLTPARG
ncbi:MAG: sensor domain-containing diguanylate cyclase [Deltaproteobacteria bacterium]|nr:sensor domain-containing diguanylate cyclase [Deltaproteobacteria bacterium]